MKVNPYFLSLLHMARNSGIEPCKIYVGTRSKVFTFINTDNDT